MSTVTSAMQLDRLPVGSVIVDAGVRDSPVVACKAARGDWQVMGDDPERRWRPHEMIEGAAGQPLDVVYRPDRSGVRVAGRRHREAR